LKDQNTVAFDTYGNTGVAKNLIFDHCSISYGGLLAFVLRGNESTNVTFQRSLIAESKTGCLFGDSQQTHFSYNNSFLNNLFYNVSHRTPNSGSDGRVDHINNVTHNWLSRLSYVNGDIKLNQINNYYSMGGRSDIKINSRHMINVLERKFDYEIYTSGNIIDKGMFTDPNADNRRLWAYFDLGKQRDLAGPEHFVSEQHPLVGIPVPIKTANEVYSEIVNNPDVGANATINDDGSVSRNEDANDKEYLAVMAQGEGAFEHYTAGNFGSDRSFYFESRYINFLSSISSDPISSRELNYDRDKDGMPNKWEILYGTNPDVPDNNSDKDGDGYTNLEEFLNSVDKNK
jgi:hypothetical protein